MQCRVQIGRHKWNPVPYDKGIGHSHQECNKSNGRDQYAWTKSNANCAPSKTECNGHKERHLNNSLGDRHEQEQRTGRNSNRHCATKANHVKDIGVEDGDIPIRVIVITFRFEAIFISKEHDTQQMKDKKHQKQDIPTSWNLFLSLDVFHKELGRPLSHVHFSWAPALVLPGHVDRFATATATTSSVSTIATSTTIRISIAASRECHTQIIWW
mmetsp:Transcript_8724/g.20880  ORF Transcript_8724/g.20880 Transcript_8724/m.20880 type:complete len:213 (-) Transcript_8724:1118-1756(-)